MTTDHIDSNGDFDLVVYEDGDSQIELTGYLGRQWKKIVFPAGFWTRTTRATESTSPRVDSGVSP
jgi:hypothetical protein